MSHHCSSCGNEGWNKCTCVPRAGEETKDAKMSETEDNTLKERAPQAHSSERHFVCELLGLHPSCSSVDIYERIERLKRAEDAEKRLLRKLGIYSLALKLETSPTPLTTIAEYLDTHTSKGDVSTVQVRNVIALCRELEMETLKDEKL